MYPVFYLSLECPFKEVDMSFEPRKTEVEFADWTAVVQFLEEAVHTFLKNNRLLVPAACINDDTDTNSVDADSAGMLIVVKNALEITCSIYIIVSSSTIDNFEAIIRL